MPYTVETRLEKTKAEYNRDTNFTKDHKKNHYDFPCDRERSKNIRRTCDIKT